MEEMPVNPAPEEEQKSTPGGEPKPGRKKPGPKPKVKEIAVTRIVLYTTEQGTHRPAIVTRVNDDGTVDLSVFNSAGCVAVRDVPEDAFTGETPGSWHWPQY